MVVFSCGDGRPREPALSEVEGSKPSGAGQLPAALPDPGVALKLTPDVAKFVETRLSHHPLGGAHRPFSESLARLGVVA